MYLKIPLQPLPLNSVHYLHTRAVREPHIKKNTKYWLDYKHMLELS